MSLRMSKKLKFWVDIALQNRQSSEKRLTLIKDVLAEFEAAGEAYRRRNRDGRVIWKPSKQMLRRLADAEREAKADLEDQL